MKVDKNKISSQTKGIIMKDAIEFKEVGECKIIHSLAIKNWSMLCHIVKSHDKYALVEYTPKGKQKLKVNISIDDAKWAIETFHLKFIFSEAFNNCGSYLQC